MGSRRVLKLVCGLAGASALVVAAVDLKGHFRDNGEETLNNRTFFGVLRAAKPYNSAQGNENLRVAPSGNGWDINWDKRDPIAVINEKKGRKENVSSTASDLTAELENNKPKATRHIILIRHSQYYQNGTGDKERFLTPLGREQAELTGQRLSALGLKYDVLVHSSMTRATETAHIIAKHLPDVEKVSCDLLREGSPIEPVPAIGHWKPESVYHVDGARIEAAFRRYIHRADTSQKEDSYEVIVCHANVIRYFVCRSAHFVCALMSWKAQASVPDEGAPLSHRALQFPPEGWLRMGLNNGSITWLSVRPSGRVGLRMLGDSGFMPPDKISRS